ncbi:MAG: 50S ribosomal protein L18 [Candidatus Levybacteria bacterium CG10_big_fil_rev_8_21_14_0_10_36_7]|nr:MAG: 50S ribosomal protein L18 [Candidatus Levybacteria bacterium CG10_big_fil_rev_8_21_14_0_10_36_7]
MKSDLLKKQRKIRRTNRIRGKILSLKSRARLTVFRSNKHIYGQIIDDVNAKTLVAVDDTKIKVEKKTKVAIAQEVGEALAEAAKSKKIKTVVFDKGSYRYHGRVKALAQGARKGGLEF